MLAITASAQSKTLLDKILEPLNETCNFKLIFHDGPNRTCTQQHYSILFNYNISDIFSHRSSPQTRRPPRYSYRTSSRSSSQDSRTILEIAMMNSLPMSSPGWVSTTEVICTQPSVSWRKSSRMCSRTDQTHVSQDSIRSSGCSMPHILHSLLTRIS